MNTNVTREQISAFIDNESSDAHVEVTLAALRSDSGRDTWNLYHQIGDALRSDELNAHLSADFDTRMFARLESEPSIVAPVSAPAQKGYLRFAMPGMAAAALAAIAVFIAPHMQQQATIVAATPGAVPVLASAASNNTVTVAGQEGEILRDPRIDDYLLAHQRFSPSVYSTAQYARSATFAVESDK
jgi:sigma-E factor negative regulatory protein RseA